MRYAGAIKVEVKTQRNLISLPLLGITLTVVPSAFCLAVLAIGNLSSGIHFVEIIFVPLPAMILIGGLIGLGTKLISPNPWLVVVGTQLGWLGGMLLTAWFTIGLFQISQYDPLSPYKVYALLICCGILVGLLPAIITRMLKRPVD